MSPRTLRVAFCHYTADVCGGSDRSLFELVTHLPRDRFTPAMILRTGDPLADGYRAEDIEVIELDFVPPRRALDFRKLAAYVLHFTPTVFRVTRALRRLQADLVHVNTLFNLQGAVAARLARIPLVWHIREIGRNGIVDRAMLLHVRLLANRAAAVSNAVAETLRGCGARVRTVLEGIDLSEYTTLPDPAPFRAEMGIPADTPVITTLGRLEWWKGQHVLVEALPAVFERFPAAIALVVGGPAVNKPEYATQLYARCRELGIDQRVHFTGIRSDAPRVLAASQVLVLPTVTPEPFGRTVVEAMAAACPVVATAAGGPVETVEDGVTGHLVPPEDAQAMAARICDVLADPARARAMGEAGRRRAFNDYSLERVVREMSALFEAVVQGPDEP